MSFLRKVKKDSKIQIISMSNLRSAVTGVKGAVIWVSAGEFAGKKGQHGPRVKVAPGSKLSREALDKAATITLENPPRVIGELRKSIEKDALAFVTLNRAVLLRYWNMKIDTAELLALIQQI